MGEARQRIHPADYVLITAFCEDGKTRFRSSHLQGNHWQGAIMSCVFKGVSLKTAYSPSKYTVRLLRQYGEHKINYICNNLHCSNVPFLYSMKFIASMVTAPESDRKSKT